MINLEDVSVGMICYLGEYQFSSGKLTHAPKVREVEITGIRADERHGYHYYDSKEVGSSERVCRSYFNYFLTEDDFWETYNKSCREQMDMITSEYEKKMARLKKNLHK